MSAISQGSQSKKS